MFNTQIKQNTNPPPSIENKLDTGKRLDYLDTLKVALTCLVVAHHAGQPYGGSGGFWYYQPPNGPEIELGRFFAVNAGFFMSLFFLISAYFLPSSLRKKGWKNFLSDRFIRLGIPALFGFLIIVPIMMYQYYLHYRPYPDLSFWSYYINVYFGLSGQPENWSGPSWPDLQFAHLWFLEHLLFYACIYTIISRWTGKRNAVVTPKPLSLLSIFLFAVVVALLTFVTRIKYPIDHWEGFLGFIQAEYAHVPQYASFFIAGVIASRRNWFTTLSNKVGITWFIIGGVLAGMYYLGFITVATRYGFTTGNLIYSFYETFLCTGLCIGLIYLFKIIANHTTSFTKTLSANSYAVYIIHVPVLVTLQYWIESYDISMISQFLFVTLFGIIFSFVISHFFLRKLPLIKQIL
ncbi:acyltransferase family protein [Robertmurraya korlensis]|uniref:acyltransferase family protein n=1 Tax=Robertmurraya korlensis TaxID=519977 RepID=UPI0008266C78|nr:acyltransferase [Robertmurraya korlensis]